jgi:hypothetical protein
LTIHLNESLNSASRSLKGIAMRLIQSLLCAAALLSPSLAFAAAGGAAPLPSEIRLSDSDKEKVLEEAAASRHERSGVPSIDDTAAAGRQVHGEVGFEVGTGGYRSAYGTAIVPLADDGVAIISLGSTNFGSRNRYPDPWWR